MPTATRWPLSNFIEIPGGIRGFDADDPNRYQTVEAAYQAAKTLDQASRDLIAAAKTPGRAKQLGRRVPLRPDWDRLAIMRLLLTLKWGGEPFRSQLLATGDEHLVEWNTWHDTFWGQCRCARHDGGGANHLGVLLMELRSQLRRVEGVSRCG